MRRHLWLLLLILAPLTLFAVAAEEKGFIFASGAGPKLRTEPKASAAETVSPPVGTRLIYRKVEREGDAVAWYWIDQPGIGSGWLAAADSSVTRPSAVPAVKPVPRVTPKPLATGDGAVKTLAAQTTSARTLKPEDAARAAREAGAAISTRALASRTLASTSEADAVVYQATVDYNTLERMIGIQMSDPPHPDGRYADVTARGRKADSELFAKTVQEGE
jgi:hypothetical protein